MSKFNNYAKKLNEIANATFAEYRAKSDAVKSAESKYNAYPWRDGADHAVCIEAYCIPYHKAAE